MYHLTTCQQNIWNLQKYYEDTTISVISGAIYFETVFNTKILVAAIQNVIAKQSGLRLHFYMEKENIYQQVVEYHSEPIPILQFQDKKALSEYATKCTKELSHLSDDSMYRFAVFQMNGQTGIFAALSHLIADAWTFSLIAKQILIAYNHLLTGKEDNKTWDYRKYISAEEKYFQSTRYEKDLEYWNRKYTNKPEKSIMKISSDPIPSIVANRFTKTLNLKLNEQIEQCCEAATITPAILFETAIIIYLAKLNPENDTITIGVPVLNRSNTWEKNTAGMFISTMPLTIPISSDEIIYDLCKRITEEHAALFRHHKYPYSLILKKLREKQNFSGNLYDVMVSYQNAQTELNATTEWFSNGYSEIPFTLHIDNRDNKGSYTWTVDYQTSVFPQEREIKLIIDRLEYILLQLVENIYMTLHGISILPKCEYQQVIVDFNKTTAEYPKNKCIHEIFQKQAKESPDRIALIFKKHKFTFSQIDDMSNSLAHVLRRKGIRQNDIVPILAKRSWHIVVAIFGIFKASGAYMPIDPDYPIDRIQYMISEVTPKVILSYECNTKLKTDIEIIELSDFDFSYKTTAITNINIATDRFGIIFTSGTTGLPKGTILSHQGAVNFAYANDTLYTQCEYVVAMSVITFDAFFLDTICPILRGCTCILTSQEEQFDGNSLSELLSGYHNLNMFITPTKFRQLLKDCQNKSFLQNFHHFYLGGEVFSEDLYNIILNHHKKAKIANVYGPTETTMWVSEKQVTDFHDISLGKPLANTQIYILDKQHTPLPVGVAGELCISGDGVGLGYLNRPELTAEKFISNPFHENTIMYCTGDLARWRADGEIEFLGRIDTQVKIRGLRIELGEIENIMEQFYGVSMAAVTDKFASNDRHYLIGYYTSETTVDEKALRLYLSSKLPLYMVPQYLMQLDTIPMTASGKIDRKDLPLPDFSIYKQVQELIPIETQTEQQLAMIWKESLHLEQVGRTDNFFELGGDSLLAISILSKIKSIFQVEFSIQDIMSTPVLKELAIRIDQAEKTYSSIVAKHKTKYILLPQQKAIYAEYRKNPQSLVYNMPVRIPLSENIDFDKLEFCIKTVMNHHMSLKTCMIAEEDEIYGIYEENTPVKIETYSNKNYQSFLRPFELEKAPLVHIGFTEDSLLFDIHHSIADGESLNLILQEIVALYNGKNLEYEKITYSDYAEFFYQKDFAAHKVYFQTMLQGDFTSIELPKRPSNTDREGNSIFFTLSENVCKKSRQFAKINDLSDTMLFFGSYGILLSKYTAQQDIFSSIILSNRVYTETTKIVGMFVNTLPVHLSVEGKTSEYWKQVKELVLNLFHYQEFPLLEIADAVGMSDKTVINTAFVYQADGKKQFTINGQTFVPELLDTCTAKFDLLFELTPQDEVCQVRIEYNCNKYDDTLISELFGAYEKILLNLTEEEISDISVLSETEYQKIIYDFNQTAVDYPKDKTIQKLFIEQAKHSPEKVALIFADKCFTYRQLNELSNGLVNFLQNKGIQVGDRVAVLLDRDEKVIIVQLAILKLGAIFIPIDRRYPKDRILYILSESNATIILKNKDNHLNFNRAWNIEDIEIEPMSSINMPQVDTKDTCYIIFTSGSTGRPKGCTLTNRGLVNFCLNNNILKTCNNLKQQICVSVNTISFDYFIAESLLPLINGYTVVLASEEESMIQEQFIQLVTSTQANIIQTTPTRYKLYVDKKCDLSYLQQFDVMVTSGETLPLELLQVLHQNSTAKIFNPLGPSECSVWVTDGELTLREAEVSASHITIGHPIANTQLYILDQEHKPVPIGVAGELCISGDGVGNGYLNQPELTTEKFLSNPFLPDKVMYCTGDLAKWNNNGEIEYLGRIDTQVKIHGLRIELTEIETAINEFPGIHMAAVSDKKDDDNRQYLVAYYSTVSSVDEKALRKYLSTKLPKYMLPNYFMHLKQLPITPSGKLDRKSLPNPNFECFNTERTFVLPHNEKEQLLCKLMSEILGNAQLGIRDDFFELGGDSIKAVEFVTKAHGKGIYFTLQQVFDYPTVELLCQNLKERRNKTKEDTYSPEQFQKYLPILEQNTWDSSFMPNYHKLGSFLLTGATGFLGAHILNTLIKHRAEKIYCLVRDTKRFLSRLLYYFNWQSADIIEKNIFPIEGDLEKEEVQNLLPEQVDYIIHAAASVKHFGSWNYFQSVNVETTRYIVEYAKKVKAKLIHISTVSVSGNSMADQFDLYVSPEEKHFYESSLYIGQPLDNVYARSKFEAELLVLDAINAGLCANIVRVGNLTNRRSDLKFQPNYEENAFLKRVKAFLELGCIPDYLMDIYAEFSPVDSTADAIIKLIEYMNDKYTIFHVNSNQNLYFNRLVEYLKRAGKPMEILNGKDFAKRIRDTINSEQEYVFEALSNDLSQDDQLQYDSNIRIENSFTIQYLKKIGFEWPEIDYPYIEGYLKYFYEIGYLEEKHSEKK